MQCDPFQYETSKMLIVRDRTIGITYRIIQITIFIYVVCWMLILQKGYQINDIAITSVSTKVKGVGFSAYLNDYVYGSRIWDSEDLIIPHLENDAIFVTTNLIVTRNQSFDHCPESMDVLTAKCVLDTQCVSGKVNHDGHGGLTGRCIVPPNSTEGTCEIYGWCPVEHDKLPLDAKEPLFPMIENFTMLIKTQAAFPRFGIVRRNIIDWATEEFLDTCYYDKNDVKQRHCPVFKFSTIFAEANINKRMLIFGGVIIISINWKCNLDWSEKNCNPTYSFRRLDIKEPLVAPGFNFRRVFYYYTNGTLKRDLFKVYGIRFLIQANGEAGKFHMLPLTITLGAGLAWIRLAPMVCDFIMVIIPKTKRLFFEKKYDILTEDEEIAYLKNLDLEKGKKNETSIE